MLYKIDSNLHMPTNNLHLLKIVGFWQVSSWYHDKCDQLIINITDIADRNLHLPTINLCLSKIGGFGQVSSWYLEKKIIFAKKAPCKNFFWLEKKCFYWVEKKNNFFFNLKKKIFTIKKFLFFQKIYLKNNFYQRRVIIVV